MGVEIVSAEVFDPAASGEYHLPARLELRTAGMPEEPTHTDLTDDFSRMHYHKFSRIFSDLPEWDDEDTSLCAAIYNSHPDTTYLSPVVPVTVMFPGEQYGMDFYIDLIYAARILRKVGGYELMPNPCYAAEKRNAWMIQHTSRACVDCTREVATATELGKTINLAGVPLGSHLYQVSPYRPAPLCMRHYEMARSRGYAPAFVV